MITIPIRRHKCELCNKIYDCIECLETMLEINSDSETWHVSLYSKDHEPLKGNRKDPLKPWICENCVL